MKEKAVKELCVYVVRYYGGKHLGNHCFDIAKDPTFAVVRRYKIHRQSSRQRWQQMVGSLTSLNSEASFVSLGAESMESISVETGPLPSAVEGSTEAPA